MLGAMIVFTSKELCDYCTVSFYLLSVWLLRTRENGGKLSLFNFSVFLLPRYWSWGFCYKLIRGLLWVCFSSEKLGFYVVVRHCDLGFAVQFIQIEGFPFRVLVCHLRPYVGCRENWEKI